MELRLALPAGTVAAIALGVGLSGLVPTRMVEAAPPVWASAIPEHDNYTSDETYRFAMGSPDDLDPSIPVGPQYRLGEDEMGYAVPASTIEPDDVPTEPVFVNVSYGTASRPAEQVQMERDTISQQSAEYANPPLVDSIY